MVTTADIPAAAARGDVGGRHHPPSLSGGPRHGPPHPPVARKRPGEPGALLDVPSVAFALVDQRKEGPAVGEAAEVLAERRDSAPGAPRRAAGLVRRHLHARRAPNRMASRQRLVVPYVYAR